MRTIITRSVATANALMVSIMTVLAAGQTPNASDSTTVDIQNWDITEEGWLWHDLKLVGLALLVITIFFFGIRYLNRGLSWSITKLIDKFQKWQSRNIDDKRRRRLNADQITKLVGKVLGIVKVFLIVLMCFIVLPIIFSIFPATEPITNGILEMVLDPIKRFGMVMINYIPSLIAIVVIVIITRFIVRLLGYFAKEVEKGQLSVSGFYPDWAKPTFNLIRGVIYIFAFVIIFPYLPGSDSPAFQGVGVLLGLMLSLGSTSAIGNIIAGLVIIYMRAFTIGDRVKIGDTTGDVIAKTMLVTRIRTIKNEDISIPNSTILNDRTINYSSSAKELGLILNTTITIGYDVPWRIVHELLIASAIKTEGVHKEPKPFVLQTSLDDFFVSYQINSYTAKPENTAKIYSDMHGHIQDAFADAGIEILSPHYRHQRDGNEMVLPNDPPTSKPVVKPTEDVQVAEDDQPDEHAKASD